jgi:hypothetical protein
MKKPSVLLVAVLALLVAESAPAADLPLPGGVTPPALLPLPTVAPVKLPDVVAPTVPSVSALPQLPAVPHLPGGTTAPAVPSVPGLPAAPARSPSGSTGGRTPAGGAPSGRPSSGPSAADTGSSAAAAGTRARARSGAGGTRRAVARVRRERRLRTTVRRLQDCLGGLSRLQRRVLVLRAGIGAGPARSRARVARRLDVSVRRVARTERRGLRTCAAWHVPGAAAPPRLRAGRPPRASRRASRPAGRVSSRARRVTAATSRGTKLVGWRPVAARDREPRGSGRGSRPSSSAVSTSRCRC